MSISFENAVETLKVMFPDWDEDTLQTILISNQYHVERTIENVLAMSGDTDVSISTPPPVQQAPPPASIPKYPSPSTSPPTNNSNYFPSSTPTSNNNKSSSRGAPSASSSDTGRYRGNRCTLGDDFLRPPGWQGRMMGDEELAMMLQNEMFQKEVRAVLGEDYVLPTGAGGGAAAAGGRPGGQAMQRNPSTNRPSMTGAAGGASGGAAGGGGDMMKALSSMGSAAKRNLSQLASRFSSRQQGNGDAIASGTRNGETGTIREFHPLVDGNDNEEAEEYEELNFDSRRRPSAGHVLQQITTSASNRAMSPSTNLGHGVEEEFMENPLLMQGGGGGGVTSNVTVNSQPRRSSGNY